MYLEPSSNNLHLAATMYPVYLEPNRVCGAFGVCGLKSITREATCDQCTDGMNGLASLLVGRSTIQDVISFLQVTNITYYKINFQIMMLMFREMLSVPPQLIQLTAHGTLRRPSLSPCPSLVASSWSELPPSVATSLLMDSAAKHCCFIKYIFVKC